MELLYFGHNIFLNKKQRYELYSGQKVLAKGFYTSIKESEKFTKTNELFENYCFYELIPKKNIFKTIKKSFKGFCIYLEKSNMIAGSFDFIKEFLFLRSNQKEIIKNILDIKDGGKEQIFIQEQEYFKNFYIKHKILIQREEVLLM
jgi:hypothetical protein